MQAALKKTKVKLDLLSAIDLILKAKKGIRRGICHSIKMQKLIANKWKFEIKTVISSLLEYGWEMSQ